MNNKKQEKAAEIAAQREKLAAQRRAEEKKKTRKWVIPTVIVALLLCIVGVVAMIVSKQNPENEALRSITVAKSEHFTVNGAMMKYWMNNLESSLKTDGLLIEDGKKLSEQTVDGENLLSYLTPMAEQQVKTYLAHAEAALKSGETVSEQQKSVMKTQADNLKNLSSDITSEDVQSCILITYLAGKYEERFDTMYFSEEELCAFGENNPLRVKVVDGICYSIPYNRENGTSVETAKNIAESCVTKGDFDAFLTKLSAVAAELNGSTAAEQKTKLENSVSRAVAYTDDEFGNWAFEEGRKEGDAMVAKDESTDCYLVYGIAKAPYYEESKTVTIYEIEFPSSLYESAEKARAQAESVLEAYEKGEKTEESFSKIAYMYNFANADNRDGFKENVSISALDTAVGNWATKTGRSGGDYELVNTADGCSVVYYVGAGLSAWQSKATEALRREKLEEDSKAYEQNVTFDVGAITELGL